MNTVIDFIAPDITEVKVTSSSVLVTFNLLWVVDTARIPLLSIDRGMAGKVAELSHEIVLAKDIVIDISAFIASMQDFRTSDAAAIIGTILSATVLEAKKEEEENGTSIRPERSWFNTPRSSRRACYDANALLRAPRDRDPHIPEGRDVHQAGDAHP